MDEQKLNDLARRFGLQLGADALVAANADPAAVALRGRLQRMGCGDVTVADCERIIAERGEKHD